MRSPFHVLILSALLFAATPSAQAQKNPDAERQGYVQRFLNLELDESNRYQVIRELVDIDPQIGYEALKEAWAKLRIDAKLSLMNTFLAAANPNIVGVFHLGATDQSLTVQNFALSAVETVAFRSFNDDYNAYLEWYNANKTKKLEEALKEGVRDFAEQMAKAPEEQRESFVQQLLSKNFVAQTRIARARRDNVLASGVMDTLGGWLSPDGSPNLNMQGLQFFRVVRPDEKLMRRYVLPLTAKDVQLGLRDQAINLLGNPDSRWAVEPLLKMLVEEYPEPISATIGQALSQIGDPRIIPTAIGMLEADNSREGIFQVGNMLAQITGVFVQETHDVTWWKDWWKKNQMRLPADVRNQPFPKLNLKRRAPVPGAFDPNQPMSEQRNINSDPLRSYWLLRPPRGGMQFGEQNNPQWRRQRRNAVRLNDRATVEQGEENVILVGQNGGNIVRIGGQNPNPNPKIGLIVVLDEGGNGANLLSTWSEIMKQTLKGRYLVALPVGPRWAANQTFPWITANNRKLIKEARFTTEAFLKEIVEDLGKSYPIDPNRVFLHGVGDGGMATYAAALEPNTIFKGFYLLSSAFRSAQLPPLKTAKGRRFLIQHSKDDKTTPYLTAAAAQKVLAEQGANVKLATYRGKHGYQFDDNMYIEIGAALTWLETGK